MRTLPSGQREKKLGKFAIFSNMRSAPMEIYDLYKPREEVEVAFDDMKNELENDKAFLHTTDGLRGYFFISFISLYMYFSILQVLKDHDLSQKISVKEALFELSKIYMTVSGARRTVSEIPKKSQKIANVFDLKLYPKIL